MEAHRELAVRTDVGQSHRAAFADEVVVTSAEFHLYLMTTTLKRDRVCADP